MSEPDTDMESIVADLAAATGSTVEEVEAGAEAFELVPPWEAEWELLEDE